MASNPRFDGLKIVEVRIAAPDASSARSVAAVIASRFPGSKVGVPKRSEGGDVRLYVTLGIAAVRI